MSGVSRNVLPFAGLFLLLIVFSVGGLFVIAREVDQSDAARAHKDVSRAFDAQLASLDGAVQMNARTAPIAMVLTDREARPSLAYAYFAFTQRQSLGFYGTMVLNRDGSGFAGTIAGMPLTGPDLQTAATLVAPIAKKLPERTDGTAHGLLRDPKGRVVAVSITNIVSPYGEARADQIHIAPRRLAMLSPVAAQMIPKIVPVVSVDGIHIVTQTPTANSVAIPVANGAPLIIAWRAQSLGRKAIDRWAPVIAFMFAAAFSMLAVALRANLSATRKLQWLATYDSMTGLPNRTAFQSQLDQRLSGTRQIAVGIADLNGFKTINDLHGHQTGDALLCAVAVQYLASAESGDFVARLGGDEFAWISPSLAAAERLAAEFSARLINALAAGDLNVRVGVCIGIALVGSDRDAQKLMKRADEDLYRRKAQLPRQISPR